MDPSSASDTLSRNVLIDMVKAQLDYENDDSRNDEDFRRDVFLCLAVTIPARQRRRVKSALELLLARARIRGSCRDSELGEDPHNLHGHHRNDSDLAAQLERSIGVISTLLVMGCEFFQDFNLMLDMYFVTLSPLSYSSHAFPKNCGVTLAKRVSRFGYM